MEPKPIRPKRVPAPKWRVTRNIEYLVPVADTVTMKIEKVDSFDMEIAIRALPDDAVAFVFYSLKEADVWVEQDLVRVGKTEKESGRYFMGGCVYAEADVAKLAEGEVDPYYQTILDNMRAHRLEQVIHTRLDTWMAFEEGDVLVPIPTS